MNVLKKLPEWKEFLGISQLKNKNDSDDYNSSLSSPLSTGYDTTNDISGSFSANGGNNSGSLDITSSEQWLEECRNLDVVINEIKTCIAARKKFVTRNETAAACEATVLARKNHNTLCSKYAALERELHRQINEYYSNAQEQESNNTAVESNPGFFSSVLGGTKKQKNRTLLSKGELSRRQDLLENIRTEKIQLEKLLGNTKSTDNSSQSNISDKGYYSVKNGSNRENSNGNSSAGINHSSSKSRRKFGVQISQEVEESTQGLDNIQILQLQKDMLQGQDKTLEQFSTILNRQRKIGETINQELDLQNELLDDLDSNVNKVQLGLGQAEKRMKKVLKK